jgi:hypothetical protein
VKGTILVAKSEMLAAHLLCESWRDDWIESDILPVLATSLLGKAGKTWGI